ncbi:MAG: hypothetical protein H0U70_04435 [Tatlockia sp.]|nr:hypothetical protein [Tatlockia sp.]
MGLRKEYRDDENPEFLPFEEDKQENLSHKRQVRKLIEERQELKRLKDDFDELDGEFDWDDFEQ